MTTHTSTLTRPYTASRLQSPPRAAKLRLAIDGRWYDLTAWQHVHPGGTQILQPLHGLDATDAFYSLHSRAAAEKLKKMHSVPVENEEKELPNAPTRLDRNFRKLRAELEREGWFERNWAWEAFYQASVYALAVAGSVAAYYGHEMWAILILGLCMQQAGWIGHDNTHGRGKFATAASQIMSGLVTGFSSRWWSNKHNTHHVYTNYLGIDVDIENDPIFHLFFPTQENDVFLRRFQHIYFPIAFCFLYVSWKVQSLLHAFKTANLLELVSFLPNYAWLVWLGWKVALGSVLLAGFLVAIIVTVTHQSEEMIDTTTEISKYSYVESQFLTTRDAYSENPLMNWLWGGMQYQLEHHLFPTMPKYYYAALQPRIQKFAKENGIEYRMDSVWQIWVRNFRTLQYFAQPMPQAVRDYFKLHKQ